MRCGRLWGGLTAVPLAGASVLAVASPYIVVLSDGSFIRAVAPPEIDGELASLRLYPSGLRSVLAAARIDRAATLWANATAPAPPAREPIVPTVSGGRAVADVPPPGRPAPPARSDAAAAAREEEQIRSEAERWSRRIADLQEEQRALESESAALRTRRDDLDRDLRRYLGWPQVAGPLARDLGQADRRLQELAARLAEVQDEIALLYARAADRNLPLQP